ncbi:MAG: hypothetical protein EPN79_11895 [Burkholderiaceae bacterium]|nr:MAG: hypothetical protein EPN79_11895 [Burkholderiaceae bacterium]TBR76874.1 MAG: hypothetical protein EPN64_06535 [Burkholderiaceae bacterium]
MISNRDAQLTDKNAQAFLDAVKGIAGHHVIAAMNLATPGVEWRNCSKETMAGDYGRVMRGERLVMSYLALDGLRRLNLVSLRRAALERQAGNKLWFALYTGLAL